MVFNVVEQDGLLWVNTENDATVPQLPRDCVGVRSIMFDCVASVAQKKISGTQLDDESGKSLTVRQVSDVPLILSYGNQQSSDSVLLLFQPLGSSGVVLHVIADQSWSVEGRVGISRWCEALRRSAEMQETISPQKESQS